MDYDVAVTVVILLLTLVVLARELLSPPATVLGAVVLLLVFGDRVWLTLDAGLSWLIVSLVLLIAAGLALRSFRWE